MSTVTQGKLNLQIDKIKFSGNKVALTEPSANAVALQMYNRVLEGEVSALDTYEALSFMSKVAEQLKSCEDELGKNKFVDLVRQEITDNADGDQKVVTTKFGSKYSLAETGTKYNFTKCGDKLWDYYSKEADRIDKLIKEREKFLKSLTTPIKVSYPDPETGEMIEDAELVPPTKTSTSSFKLEIKKA
jgi:hypothetical protein